MSSIRFSSSFWLHVLFLLPGYTVPISCSFSTIPLRLEFQSQHTYIEASPYRGFTCSIQLCVFRIFLIRISWIYCRYSLVRLYEDPQWAYQHTSPAAGSTSKVSPMMVLSITSPMVTGLSTETPCQIIPAFLNDYIDCFVSFWFHWSVYAFLSAYDYEFIIADCRFKKTVNRFRIISALFSKSDVTVFFRHPSWPRNSLVTSSFSSPLIMRTSDRRTQYCQDDFKRLNLRLR